MIDSLSKADPAAAARSSTITPEESADPYDAPVAARTASRSSTSRSTVYSGWSPESPRPRRS